MPAQRLCRAGDGRAAVGGTSDTNAVGATSDTNAVGATSDANVVLESSTET